MSPANPPPNVESVDVIVVGAGIAGLTAALHIAQPGIRTVCVDKAEISATPGQDYRTTAFFQPALRLLENLGIWNQVEPHAARLRTIRIVDRGSGRTARTLTTRLQARDLHVPDLAYNIPNPVIRTALLDAAATQPNLELISSNQVVSLTRRDDAAFVVLENGRHFTAQLVIAADGRDSPTRVQAGIPVWRCGHGRKALAFHVQCERDLNGVCTETHGSGDVVTMVPLPNAQAAVVWIMPGPIAVRYAETTPAEWVHNLHRNTTGTGGNLRVISPVHIWPEATLLARRLVAQRLALVAEAAHAMSPIGAQGLNLSLADIESLAAAVHQAYRDGHDLGNANLLQGYERARWPHIAARVAAVETYSVAAASTAGPLVSTRRAALRVLAQVPSLRRFAVRLGTGTRWGHGCAPTPESPTVAR